MAAGDLVVADYQIELRATLMGDGSNYPLDFDQRQQWMPLGEGSTKTADVELLHANGSYGSDDFDGPLVFNFPFIIDATTHATAETRAKTLRETVWATSSTDIPLYQKLPGIGKFYVMGRPRKPYVENRSEAQFGTIRVLATFVALDPTITYV